VADRVLLLHGSDGWYGSDRALYTLSLALRRRGIEPVVLIAGVAGSGLGELRRRLAAAGIETRAVPGSLADRRALRSPLSFLLATVRGSVVLARLARRERAPIVANSALVAHLTVVPRLAGVPVAVVFRELLGPLARLVTRHLYSRVASLSVCPSRATEDCNVPRSRRRRSLVATDEPVAAGAEPAAEPSPGPPLALVVGRLNPKREPHIALDAVTRCLERGHDLRLMLVGDGDSPVHAGYVEELRRRAAAPPLAGRVAFAGFVQDPTALIAASDLVVNPAPQEALGHVVLEAMRAGKPVIACAAGGPLEHVRPDETGAFFAPGDAEGLARELERLLDQPEERRRLGLAGRAAWEELERRIAADHDRLADRLQQIARNGRRRRHA
jgi:glycosyltransferase involved in cell wall biosynthesis